MIPSTHFLKDSGLEIEKSGYIPANDRMETNLEGIYAVGDNRVKYLRQVVSAAGDGATAAVAAERYIAELKDFNANILKNDKKILLLFFNVLINESLEFSTLLERLISENGDEYKIFKVDMATKKHLAGKYEIGKVPAVVVLDKGNVIKRLDCSMDKEKLKSQLF